MLGIFLLVSLVIILQIGNRNKLLVQRRKMDEEKVRHQRELTDTLIRSQEAERKRIGMDLHDEVGTALSSLRMILESLGYGDARQDSAVRVKNIIDNIMVNVRQISHDLSPFLRGGYDLKEALEDLTERINAAGKLRAELEWEVAEDIGLADGVARLALYRVISELVNNSIRHASASMLWIAFRRQGELFAVSYRDDGVGLSQPAVRPGGRGMMNMESRLNLLGATWSIDAPPGQGFRIDINIRIQPGL